MSIRRLDPDTNMSGLPLMVPADDGGYVDYDDHVAEVERLAADPRLRLTAEDYEWAIYVAENRYHDTWWDVEDRTPRWLARIERFGAALAAEKGDDHE